MELEFGLFCGRYSCILITWHNCHLANNSEGVVHSTVDNSQFRMDNPEQTPEALYNQL
jgi:hypothetical protein